MFGLSPKNIIENSTGIKTDNLALTVANAVPARLIAFE